MQAWIIETANSAPDRGDIEWGRDREDGVRVKIRVGSVSSGGDGAPQSEVECFPGHFVFATGMTESEMYNVSRAPSADREMRVLLAGQGGARGAGGVRVRIGSVIGIRPPIWETEIGGEAWDVGIDWAVL
jgi:hypothetical protein